MPRQLTYCVLGILLAAQVQGQNVNWIFQHNSNLELGEDYAVNQFAKEVTILQAVPGETFEFEARWGRFVGELWVDDRAGDIDLITANDNAGAFTITVVPDIGTFYGARDVKEIKLDQAGVTSTIASMKLSGSLGELGPAVADTITLLQFVTLLDDITCDSLGNLQVGGVGTVTSTIQVTGNAGIISIFPVFDGTLTVGGDLLILFFNRSTVAGSQIVIGGNCLSLDVDFLHAGDISIGGDLTTATLSSQLKLSTPGDIEVVGDLLGAMTFFGEFLGIAQVHGDCPGSIDIADDLTGSITIDGDLSGSIDVGGRLDDAFGGGGFIIVNGSFLPGADITVGFPHASFTEFIAIDYDAIEQGPIDPDGWNFSGDCDPLTSPNAVVEIAGVKYVCNEPSVRVWEISPIKGDMNNDWALNGADIDPFFLGFGDPLAYAAAYPGLAGSRIFHGDCNCDDKFNGADIDPFFDLLAGGAPCGFSFWDPEYVAWLIETHVRPDRLDRAIALIDAYTRGEARPDRRRFWNAVLDILAPG